MAKRNHIQAMVDATAKVLNTDKPTPAPKPAKAPKPSKSPGATTKALKNLSRGDW